MYEGELYIVFVQLEDGTKIFEKAFDTYDELIEYVKSRDGMYGVLSTYRNNMGAKFLNPLFEKGIVTNAKENGYEKEL